MLEGRRSDRGLEEARDKSIKRISSATPERNRITLEELAAAARQSQLDSLDDVRWAVLETNGTISFIPKRA